MRKDWWLVILGVALLGMIVVLWQVGLARFEVESEFAGKSFKVSRVWGNVFLIKQGYWGRVRRIKLTYTPTEQNNLKLYNGSSGELMQSASVEKRGLELEYRLHYGSEGLEMVESRPERPDLDLYAYLCVVLDREKPGRDGCYQRAAEYLEWLRRTDWGRLGLGRAVRLKKKISLKLARTAYASCVGTIYCGEYRTDCTCNLDGSACTYSGEECGPLDAGTCSCATTCDWNAEPMKCSSLTSKNLCINAGVWDCAVGCSLDPEKPCSWVTPTPVDCDAVCTTWSPGNCGANPCDDDQKKYTRDCGSYSSVCEETECRYRAVCDCTPTDPDAASLLLPADGHVETGDFSVDLSWSAPASWGVGCARTMITSTGCMWSLGTARRMCWRPPWRRGRRITLLRQKGASSITGR